MSGMMDNVKTVNSVLRTLIALVVIGAAGVAGWLGISTYYAADWARQEKEQQLTEVQARLEDREKQIAAQQTALREKDALLAEKDGTIRDLTEEVTKLETANHLLKVDHRLAEIKVLDIGADDSGSFVDVTFQEISDEGQPIDELKNFRLRGDEIRVDSWVVQFDDKYVEQQDLHRSTSILLFKKIYGNAEASDAGHLLESIGTRPTAYARGKPLSEFEKKIWDDFWLIANDKDKANELGIRDAGGFGNFKKAVEGKTYIVKLRASGGPTLD
jgi:hypothetical protein